jgi:hypothetical protein
MLFGELIEAEDGWL